MYMRVRCSYQGVCFSRANGGHELCEEKSACAENQDHGKAEGREIEQREYFLLFLEKYKGISLVRKSQDRNFRKRRERIN